MSFKVGQTIKAPFLSSQAEVKKYQHRGGYALLEVVLKDESNTYKSMRLTDEQLDTIEIIERSQISSMANNEDFFFFIEANRIRLAYQFDPQLAVSISQVDPLPHQIEAVYRYILNDPHIRFLIADDPGAGKTIMAGLVLKELQYRRLVQRVLIVAPGHLKYQWQREMKERFQTRFSIVDRNRMESSWGENVWEEKEHLITSIDFAKQDDVRHTLRGTQWDLIIVDEAHKMSAYAYETKNKTKINKTKRYQLGEVLSGIADHLLFLTATPHKGDEENFRLFLDLLRPGFFAKTELLQESIEQKDNPVFIRRLKEDMYDFDGMPLFPPRHVHSVRFQLTYSEKQLYNQVTRYVQDYFDKAKENRSISFALMILQRRLTSSTHAIYRSLVRRKERLEDLLLLPEKIREDEDFLKAKRISEDELDDMQAEEREKIEERLMYLTIAENIDDVKAEISQLETLITQAEEVRAQETESKLVGLRDNVLSNLGDQKLLIFSEFRDTVDYLIEKLRAWGYKVVTIHGQMNMDARIEAEHHFRDEAQIMVATEAAGEGINLQFCSLMVNYDIPWNPNRLEQRMGRVHRYGQTREVHIWNMISLDTREGEIMHRLFMKLEAMREALGSDRVFDIMGEIIPGARLDELIKEALFSQRRIEEIEANIDAIDAVDTQQTLDRVFLTGLATRHIDYTGIKKESLLAEENRLVPEYIADFFLRTYRHHGGGIERVGNGEPPVYRLPHVPYTLRRWNENYDFKVSFGTIFKTYNRITFDKKHAKTHPQFEFIAPGHPLLEALNEEILENFSSGLDTYAIFADPQGDRQGVLWFVEGAVADGTGALAGKRVFCLYQPIEGTLRVINPAILWDLEPIQYTDCQTEELAQIESQIGRQDEIEDHLITAILLPFRDEIAQRRTREANIKEKYGLRSLDYLIQESNQKILDYQVRDAMGESMDLPILNEQRNLAKLKDRRDALAQEIKLEKALVIQEPRLLGVAAILPIGDIKYDLPGSAAIKVKTRERTGSQDSYHTDETDTGIDPESRAEIEAVGMKIAIQYEYDQGWHPEDVSGENHGFDLRSTRYNQAGAFVDVRYIEVKARAQTGAIRLTSNEWKKARHFADKYWLYIVTQAGTQTPELHRIQNPAGRFRMDEDILATGFIIPKDKWQATSQTNNTCPSEGEIFHD